VQNNTDPDLDCQDSGGPCGPNGNGCTGNLATAHCQGYSCSCAQQYTHAAIYTQCFQTGAECQLRVNTATATCAQICQAGGGSCTRVYNDNPDGTCNPDFGQTASCNTNNLTSAICYCSRGCAGNAACVAPLICTSDLCQ
jgi:hypothetical protein